MDSEPRARTGHTSKSLHRPQRRSLYRLLAIMLVAGAIGYLFHTELASADWYDDQGKTYTVYKKGSNFLYWNGRTNTWAIMSGSTPQVHLDGKSCNTPDANIDFDGSKTFYECTGLEITAHTQSTWFNEANLAFKIGDFDSKETVKVDGGRVTKKGSLNSVTIASDGKSAKSDSSGCSGGNPNKTESCSILIVFSYSDGNSFKIDLDNEWNGAGHAGSTGHEYYYDGPSVENYQTLTFDPNGGAIPNDQKDKHSTVTLWERSSGDNLLREYKKGACVGYYPTPTWAGHTFDGWYDGTTNRNLGSGDVCVANNRFKLDDDHTLTAHWTTLPYTLTPHVNVPVTTVRAGGSVTFTPNVTNSISYSNATSWNVRRITIPPAGSVPYIGTRTTGDFDCSYYTSKGMTCTDVDSGSRTFMTTNPTYVADSSGYTYGTASNLPFGTRVCYALAINSHTQDADHPAEALQCVVVAKSPRLWVWGNDVHVGSGFSLTGVSTSSLIDTNKNSWGEYGVLAPGFVTNFGSGSGASASGLTFANTSPAKGAYTTSPSVLGTIPSVETYLRKAGNKGLVSVDDRAAANLSVGSFEANKVYITKGTVTITGNITNASTGADLKQMVIIAGNILINPGVRQVDAWLIATDTVNTCPVNPTVDNCNTQLVINGPIMAKKLRLQRTGGDDTDPRNSPAEIVNLRGDAYAWMYTLSQTTGTVRTVYTRELAPRY